MALHCKANFLDKEKLIQFCKPLSNTPKRRTSICLPHAKNWAKFLLGGVERKQKPTKTSHTSEILQLVEGRIVVPHNEWKPVRFRQCSWIITTITQENQIPWCVWCFLNFIPLLAIPVVFDINYHNRKQGMKNTDSSTPKMMAIEMV